MGGGLLDMTLNCIWGKAPVLEIWEVPPSLVLLPSPLWPRLVVAIKGPSIGQIDLFANYLY